MNSEAPTRFERGLLLRTDVPSGQEKLWSKHRGTGEYAVEAYKNSAHGLLGDEQARWEAVEFPNAKLVQLRPDQVAAVEAWEQEKKGVVVMPTGTGKTEVALQIIVRTGSHVLFVTPTRALAYQIVDRLEKSLGSEVGFIGDQTFRLCPVSVATYESAAIKMEWLGDYFKLIVFDECHHLAGDFLTDGAKLSAAPFRLGLTATPHRSNSQAHVIRDLVGPICYEMPFGAAAGTLLAKYQVKRIPVLLTDAEQAEYDSLGTLVAGFMAEKRKDEPRFTWEDVSRNMASDPRCRHVFFAHLRRRAIEERAVEKLNVLEDIFQEHSEQVIVFAGSNIMARQVSTRFLIPCLLATTGKKERLRILSGYELGKFRAIVANRVLNEGIDVPAAKVGIVIGGTGAEREAIQRLGRILRKSGGQQATLYEVVCSGTGEEQRSRNRRRNSAYEARMRV